MRWWGLWSGISGPKCFWRYMLIGSLEKVTCLKSPTVGWRDSAGYVLATASFRIWVQISSSHMKSRAWSCVSVTPVLCRNGDRRMAGIFWLPAWLQVQGEILTEGNKAESLHVYLHMAHVQTHACTYTYTYVHAHPTPPRYRKFATFSSLKCRKLGCFRIQVLSYSFDNQLTCVSPLFLTVEILDDDRIQILQSLTVAEAEVNFSSLVDWHKP